MSFPQLVAPEPSETDILKQRIEELEQELEKANEKHEREVTERLAHLRKMPEVQKLYSMLRLLFDGASVQATASPSNSTDSLGRWEKMKQKLGGKQAEIIQALLDHGPATRSQLRVITGSGMSTVDAVTAKLRDMGLIVKVGDSWKLRD